METHVHLTEVHKLKRKHRIGRVARTILLAVGTAGFIAMTVMTLNALRIFDNKRARQRKWYMWKVLRDLETKGFLEKTKKGNREGYSLTEKGEGLAVGYELGTIKIPKQWRWDRKWRIVISDIPEIKRGTRDELRSVLIGLGFIQIQKSVWVFPYPCAETISLIKKKFDLRKEVIYLETDVIENDYQLRKIFHLN